MTIDVKSLSDKLVFSTVRLEAGGNVGTGFFYLYEFGEDKKVPVIITNKHVVNDEKSVKFSMHTAENKDGKLIPSGKYININYTSNWFMHPDEEVDLCAFPMHPLIVGMKEKGHEPYYQSLGENIILSDEELKELSSVEDVLMIGYPIGLWDDSSGMPLIRKGITSLHPSFDFKGKSVGVIDIACFNGSSGSPVLIVNEGVYKTAKGTNIGDRVILLGVLFAGPTYNTEGEIVIEETPVTQRSIVLSKTMINLGFYIKAKQIKTLGDLIKREVID